ncbi:MAG: hypothetical protein M1819_006507 [Sarea resinae]|nr:MAG: hypothetical protein M1819_006507 [Sarea resinae]
MAGVKKMNWDATADQQLLLTIIGTQSVKVDNEAVAAQLGCTPRSVVERLKKLRKQARDEGFNLNGDAPSPNGTDTSAPVTPQKGRAKAKATPKKTAAGTKGKPKTEPGNTDDEDFGGDDDNEVEAQPLPKKRKTVAGKTPRKGIAVKKTPAKPKPITGATKPRTKKASGKKGQASLSAEAVEHSSEEEGEVNASGDEKGNGGMQGTGAGNKRSHDESQEHGAVEATEEVKEEVNEELAPTVHGGEETGTDGIKEAEDQDHDLEIPTPVKKTESDEEYVQ